MKFWALKSIRVRRSESRGDVLNNVDSIFNEFCENYDKFKEQFESLTEEEQQQTIDHFNEIANGFGDEMMQGREEMVLEWADVPKESRKQVA